MPPLSSTTCHHDNGHNHQQCEQRVRQAPLVTFSDENLKHVIESIPKEHKDAVWYNRSELKQIRRHASHTADLINSGIPQPAGHCYRGLEHKAEQNRRRRRKAIHQAIDVVLMEQRQLRNGIAENADELLASVYAAYTSQYQEEAFLIGLQDSIYSQSSTKNEKNSSVLCDYNVGSKHSERQHMRDTAPRVPRRR